MSDDVTDETDRWTEPVEVATPMSCKCVDRFCTGTMITGIEPTEPIVVCCRKTVDIQPPESLLNEFEGFVVDAPVVCVSHF